MQTSDKPRIALHHAVEIIKANAEQQLKNPYQAAVINLQGPPGIGKTAILKNLAEEMGWQFKHDNLGIISFEKVSGIPDIDDNMVRAKKLLEAAETLENLSKGKKDKELKERAKELREKAIRLMENPEEKSTKWSRPELIDFSEYEKDKPILWLLDDWHLASTNVQAMAFELFTERKLQNHRIPENVIIVLAQNDSSEAGYKKSLSPVINRSQILNVYMDFNYWYENFGIHNVHPAILAFMKENPQSYSEPENAKAPFGTYRSWTNFSPILESLEKQYNYNIPHNILSAAVSGIASRKTAAEFVTYYNVFSKFDTEGALKHAKFPSDKSRVTSFAFTIALNAKYSALFNEAKSEKERQLYTENLLKYLTEELEDRSIISGFMSDLKIRNVNAMRYVFKYIMMPKNKSKYDKFFKEITQIIGLA